MSEQESTLGQRLRAIRASAVEAGEIPQEPGEVERRLSAQLRAKADLWETMPLTQGSIRDTTPIVCYRDAAEMAAEWEDRLRRVVVELRDKADQEEHGASYLSVNDQFRCRKIGLMEAWRSAADLLENALNGED